MHQESGQNGLSSSSGISDPPGYRLVRLLGRGGMGEVYVADDLTLGRQVAIKFLTRGHSSESDAGRRLLREAQAAAALDHPYICTVHETGVTSDGRAFVVMQYVEGQLLSSLLEGGPLPVREAMSICADLAEALAAAHKRGIIHRDLKPANVIVTPSGRPKLLDLGIAEVVSTAAEASQLPTQSGTTSGTIVGTPGYMSPEQIRGERVDARTDLFSLGALLYECLTGTRAFGGTSAVEIGGRVLHVHPPAPSAIRRDLSDDHDELCRRLLAKDRGDRFHSADEVVGAVRLLVRGSGQADARTDVETKHTERQQRRGRRTRVILAAVPAIAILIGGGALVWLRSPRLPPAPPEAEVWYRRGTEAIHEGLYLKGRVALNQAVTIFPDYVLAYARLAEAHAELDDERGAQAHLLKLTSLVPNEARLPERERLRLGAIRALVLRDVARSIDLYRRIAEKDDRGEAEPWLDLGRAQEAAGLLAVAQESYEQAIARDRQYAAAHVRLGYLHGLESRRDKALAAFGEAERLYQASSDSEGLIEVLIGRGLLFDAIGEVKAARTELERALEATTRSNSTNQQIRARLALSSVTASEGRLTAALELASAAVSAARHNGMDVTAADGLTDLGATLLQLDQLTDAEAHVRQAIAIADARAARRTAARARVQLASILDRAERPSESLALVNEVLPFLRENRYQRLELTALTIAARAHERLHNLEEAQRTSAGVLSIAETLKDDGQVAIAAGTLASVSTALGQLPEALKLRERTEIINRRQGDQATLPYTLANRAELLIRLGRTSEAGQALQELEKGIAAGIDTYVGRKRRAMFLRALAATTTLRCPEALDLLAQIEADRAAQDSAALMASGLRAFCEATLGRANAALAARAPGDGALAREREYWLAAAALRRGDNRPATTIAGRALDLLREGTNDELKWRFAAVGSVAAGRLGNRATAAVLSEQARSAYIRLRDRWKGDFQSYEQRPDLQQLRSWLDLR